MQSVIRPESTIVLEAPDRHALWNQVGNTPLLRLKRLAGDLSPAVELFAKAEWFNPGGSIKDRPAAAILRQALESGDLGQGRGLLDSTSGNMGISYATLGAALGLRVHLAIPANASPSRIAMLKALGAELTLTDPIEGSDGAREVAAELAARAAGDLYYADQYSNPANWQAHYETTGPEIVGQTGGRITHFVAGLGTTGTMTGTGRYLRQALGRLNLVAVQPEGPMHGLEGLKHLASSPIPPIFDAGLPDQTIEIPTSEAYEMARTLARREGLLVGISSAAAAVAGLRLARQLHSGVIVMVFPDSAAKYLHLPFWSQP
jgi:cysteine synthase B